MFAKIQENTLKIWAFHCKLYFNFKKECGKGHTEEDIFPMYSQNDGELGTNSIRILHPHPYEYIVQLLGR